ncbi:hypothetical protein SCHPADRAFT_893655 [Schizopora paradoxa]|uniref:Uncharacterized protein n=1 Tax=Schizopora paradoxa TaxID=27342 RepID=A0A0H2RGV3_9AGAM|nr:hypothetical protein SCHPADRAFT_893655 [Schizopora paradoxa]
MPGFLGLGNSRRRQQQNAQQQLAYQQYQQYMSSNQPVYPQQRQMPPVVLPPQPQYRQPQLQYHQQQQLAVYQYPQQQLQQHAALDQFPTVTVHQLLRDAPSDYKKQLTGECHVFRDPAHGQCDRGFGKIEFSVDKHGTRKSTPSWGPI